MMKHNSTLSTHLRQQRLEQTVLFSKTCLDRSTGADHSSRAFQVTPSVALSLSISPPGIIDTFGRCSLRETAWQCLVDAVTPLLLTCH